MEVRESTVEKMKGMEGFSPKALNEAEKYIRDANISLSQGKYEALCDIILTLGINGFHKSELYMYVILGYSDNVIIHEIMSMDRITDTSSVLFQRRRWEVMMWNQ